MLTAAPSVCLGVEELVVTRVPLLRESLTQGPALSCFPHGEQTRMGEPEASSGTSLLIGIHVNDAKPTSPSGGLGVLLLGGDHGRADDL